MYIKMFNSFKANEDLVTIDDSDESDFLMKVKKENPNLYNRFFSMFRNRGLNIAKIEYAKFKKEARIETKADKQDKKAEKLISINPSKEEIASVINRNFSTPQFRQMCNKLNFPQLSSEAFELEIVTNKKDNGTNSILKIDIPIYKKFKNLSEYVKGSNKQDIKKEIEYQHNKYLNSLRFLPDPDILNKVSAFRTKRYFDEDPKDIPSNLTPIKNEEFCIKNSLGIKIKYYISDYNTTYGKELEVNCYFSTRLEDTNNSKPIKLESTRALITNDGSANIGKQILLNIIGECLEELRDKVLNSKLSVTKIMDKIDDLKLLE